MLDQLVRLFSGIYQKTSGLQNIYGANVLSRLTREREREALPHRFSYPDAGPMGLQLALIQEFNILYWC